jgi:hypothetical protein
MFPGDGTEAWHFSSVAKNILAVVVALTTGVRQLSAFGNASKRVLRQGNQARRRSISRIMPKWMNASQDSCFRS